MNRSAPPSGLLQEGQRQRPAGGRLTAPIHLIRAATAVFAAAAGGGNPRYPVEVCRARWPGDEIAPRLVRAASTPALLSDSTWAGMVGGNAVAEFFSTLPASAGSKLVSAGTTLDLTGIAEIAFPRAGTLPALAFVPEAGPIPVIEIPIEAGSVGPPKKIAAICVVSGELAAISAAEVVIGQHMREAAAGALDVALFSAAAADSTRPAGLFFGLTPIASTTMAGDISALLAAVVAGGGNLETTVLIASPQQSASLLVAMRDLRVTVWPCKALPAGSIVAIDTSGFASGFNSIPDFSVSRDSAVHMDTSPVAIGTPGSPAVVAAPTSSLWQANLFGIRLIARIAFAMRAPGLIAIVDDAEW